MDTITITFIFLFIITFTIFIFTLILYFSIKSNIYIFKKNPLNNNKIDFLNSFIPNFHRLPDHEVINFQNKSTSLIFHILLKLRYSIYNKNSLHLHNDAFGEFYLSNNDLHKSTNFIFIKIYPKKISNMFDKNFKNRDNIIKLKMIITYFHEYRHLYQYSQNFLSTTSNMFVEIDAQSFAIQTIIKNYDEISKVFDINLSKEEFYKCKQFNFDIYKWYKQNYK